MSLTKFPGHQTSKQRAIVDTRCPKPPIDLFYRLGGETSQSAIAERVVFGAWDIHGLACQIDMINFHPTEL